MEIGEGIVFPDFQAFQKVVDRALNDTHLSETYSPLDVGVILVLVLEILNCFIKRLQGLCVFLELSVNQSQIIMSLSICSGTEFERLFKALDGLLQLNVDRSCLHELFVVVDLLKLALTQ